MELVFLVSALVVSYAYVLYPVIVVAWSRLFAHKSRVVAHAGTLGGAGTHYRGPSAPPRSAVGHPASECTDGGPAYERPRDSFEPAATTPRPMTGNLES